MFWMIGILFRVRNWYEVLFWVWDFWIYFIGKSLVFGELVGGSEKSMESRIDLYFFSKD